MDPLDAPRDRTTPWVLGTVAGVALSYLAMIILVTVWGWIGLSHVGDRMEWLTVALGCAVAAVASNVVAIRLGASTNAAGWIAVLSVGTVLVIGAVFLLIFAFFADWALEGF